MKITYVVRSYVGQELNFGEGVKIKPYFFTEVDKAVMDAMGEQDKLNLRIARDRRDVSIAMVKDDQPVAAMNEAIVLQQANGD